MTASSFPILGDRARDDKGRFSQNLGARRIPEGQGLGARLEPDAQGDGLSAGAPEPIVTADGPAAPEGNEQSSPRGRRRGADNDRSLTVERNEQHVPHRYRKYPAMSEARPCCPRCGRREGT